MKKILYFLIFVVCFQIHAEAMKYRVLNDTILYSASPLFEQYIVKNIEKDQIVTLAGDFSRDEQKINGIVSKVLSMKIVYNDTYYNINAADVIPASTDEVFDSSFLFEFSGENEYWIADYYLDVIKSKKRESIFKYEPYYADFKKNFFNWFDYNGWWDIALQSYASFHFFNTCIIIDSSPLYPTYFINKIMTVSNGYNVSAITNYTPDWNSIEFNHDILPWFAPYANMEQLTLLLRIDGGYMDVYVNDESNKMCTLVQVDKAFIDQFEYLLKTNTCDLTNVTFPRRADKNHTIGTSCIVAENLRLRKEESTTSAALQTMQTGTSVKILQLGKKQMIDGITANWVQVELDDGTRGWCFGGYLVEK